MPAALKRKPQLYGWMNPYLRAFWFLSGRRQYGMGPNPIMFFDMVTYLQLYGSNDFQEFLDLICLLDEQWLASTAKRKK